MYESGVGNMWLIILCVTFKCLDISWSLFIEEEMKVHVLATDVSVFCGYNMNTLFWLLL